ncbi:MAG: HEAT repeat domain-containing protein [Planctomycetota bacterium]|jgi:hypothetical protein
MGSDKRELPGIIQSAFKHTGSFVGKTVVIGKKTTGLGVKGVGALKNLVTRPVESPMPEASTLKPETEEATVEEGGVKVRAAVLESDLAATRRAVAEARSEAEKARSDLALQLNELQAEKESLLSRLKAVQNESIVISAKEGVVKTRVVASESNPAAKRHELKKAHSNEKAAVVSPDEKVEPLTEAPAPRQEVDAKLKVQKPRPLIVKAKAPVPVGVTPEDVRAAVFSNAAERIIFTRALSSIAGQDANVRADAVRTIGAIRHKLSIKILVIQLACETSPYVRQECVKALTRQEVNEGLRAVKRALTDQAALVRLTAVWGLYRLAGAASAPALMSMFSDEDKEVRRRAVTCIGWLGQQELAVELLPLLSDRSVCVRLAAVEAMGKLSSRQVVSTLIEHLSDPEKSVRKAILDTLKRITGKKMSGPLPRDKESLRRFIARWREWWNEELLG